MHRFGREDLSIFDQRRIEMDEREQLGTAERQVDGNISFSCDFLLSRGESEQNCRLTMKTREGPMMRKGMIVEGERKWYMRAIGGGYPLKITRQGQFSFPKTRLIKRRFDSREESQRPENVFWSPYMELLYRERMRFRFRRSQSRF